MPPLTMSPRCWSASGGSVSLRLRVRAGTVRATDFVATQAASQHQPPVTEAEKQSLCVSILTLVFSLPALVGA